jgi:Prenyltransferase and squalene oxidase repeat
MMPRLFMKMTAIIAAVLLTWPPPALAAASSTPQTAASAGLQYLANNQNSNGSISGYGGESEWSVEALEAAGQDPSTFAHNGSASLLDFVKTDVPGAGAPVTTLERNIIAIAAAGQGPSSFGGTNYDALLESQHVGGQIGDPTLLNDDMFGIIAIDAAHVSALQAEAQDGLDYLLANQDTDGGFSYTTTPGTGSDNNDTAAAIIAMYAAQDLGLTAPNLDTAESNALAYLLSTQQTDGGFAYDNFSPSDGDSTAWSLMALNAIGNSVSAQATAARNWLLQDQNPDGGFSYGAYGVTDSDTYTTAQAVIAVLGTTWLLRPSPISVTAQAPPPTTPSPAAAATQSTQSAPPTPPPSGPPPSQGPPPAPADTASTVVNLSPTPPPSGPPARKTTRHFATAAKKAPAYPLYGAGLLVLVALIWLVVEFTESTEEVPNGS